MERQLKPRPKMSAQVYDKTNPFPARMTENRVLNKTGSIKETRHHVIDISGSGMTYTPGDSLGVFASNRPGDVADLLTVLKADGLERVRLPRSETEVSFHEALTRHVSLAGPTRKIIQWVADQATSAEDHAEAQRLLGLEADALRDWLEPRWFIDVVEHFPSAPWTPQALADQMRKLMPRLYSIASSPLLHPESIHLTIAVIRYEFNGRQRVGVCSSYLADRVLPAVTPVSVFVASSPFGLPKERGQPLIMIGPGTGIAPFRSFLQERKAASDEGKNWLFFGDQHESTDFLYREELEAFQKEGVLHRLDCAWSRDQAEKVYVQDKIRAAGKDLASWIAAGAYVYVCGDAKRMAKDVDQALHDILALHLGMSADDAAAYLKAMRKEKRYQRDVY